MTGFDPLDTPLSDIGLFEYDYEHWVADIYDIIILEKNHFSSFIEAIEHCIELTQVISMASIKSGPRKDNR